jgi:WS/DGAT/MGAT family acyltransferase
MARGDRLSALDATFLHLERGGAHMHVAAVLVFEGAAPAHDELIEAIESKLHLVPRYRQRLAQVPLQQGRPVWVDDPHFNPGYHIRHTALPAPGTDAELKRLAGRLFAQPLDRSKPLWEIWLVEGLADRAHAGQAGGSSWALLSKTHHALVDGVSGVDITAVLLDACPDPAPVAPPERAWMPAPLPHPTQLLAEALVERATQPREIVRGLRALTRAPRQALNALAETTAGLAAMAVAGFDPAPPSPFNVEIGPHRRYEWLDGDLSAFKAIKDALGGTVNDVVLTAVTLALGRHLRRHGHDTRELVLKAMVPVSVRADAEQGALGNRVSNMYAPLPVGLEDPAECFAFVHAAMEDLKSSGQAVGAEAITKLGEFAPPTIMIQAARLQARQRFFNLVVTNVPGPQLPLYVLGRRMIGLYPVVPLAQRQALGIAVMSYDGRLGFGLLADFDAVPELEKITAGVGTAIEDLARAAGLRRGKRAAANGAPGGRAPSAAPAST